MRFPCVAGVAAGLALLTAHQASAGTPAAGAPDLHQAAISDSELEGMSGGTATLPPALSMVLTGQNLTATNTGNTVSAGNNVDSGQINLGSNAFQGFGGIGNFVMNTGHNNNLLGSLSVAIDTATTTVGPQ
jgi:hypothetical protein